MTYAPCPICKQYSHSIGDDALADAFKHFQSMYAHPVRGHPMGHNFDEKTRDAAQVLMTAARARRHVSAGLTDPLDVAFDYAADPWTAEREGAQP